METTLKVLGIYGSPRNNGNTDQLLDMVLKGSADAGLETSTLYVRKLKINGCTECDSCDKTDLCVIKDDMHSVYNMLDEAGIIILAAPIFYYNVPAKTKALIDRTQVVWFKRMKQKGKERQKDYENGRGYFISVGGTKGDNLFEGTELTVKYFFESLDKSYEGGLFYRSVEGKGAIKKHPTALDEAYALGKGIINDQE